MDKKIITVIILVVFITNTILSGSVYAIGSIIRLKADLDNINKPLDAGDYAGVSITVNYEIDMQKSISSILKKTRIGRVLLFGFFKGYFFKMLTKNNIPKAKVNLSVESPEWCNATLKDSILNFDLNANSNFITTILIIKEIKPDAPALTSENITITAYSEKIGNIKESNAEINIPIMAAYSSKIIINSEMDQYNISPINETVIPIEIKNEGNGESKISIEYKEIPYKWKLTLDRDEIILDVGQTDVVLLYVTPAKDFINDTVKLKFIPMSTSDEKKIERYYLMGDPVYLDIFLQNDGSFKDKNGNNFPLFEIIVVVIIMFVLIVIIYFLFFRYREKPKVMKK